MNQLDVEYFEWLASQIRVPRGRTYNNLFEKMHETVFLGLVANDDNRVKDGLDLRTEFLHGTRAKLSINVVSILEVLVALSRRVAFTAGGEPDAWAWKLVKNLGLGKMADPLNERQMQRVDDILEALVFRTYRRDGQGGFFPLHNPEKDQRKVEIWYQLNAYVNELNGTVHLSP